jgi:hypothetical protein
MTDEMRAVESLVRALAPSGHDVPIPEPLAIDESRWFMLAVDKGLIEFSRCDRSCARSERGETGARDHFRTGSDDPHHLFAHVGAHRVALQRDYIPAIAAYARAVFDFGYDSERGVLLGRRPVRRRLVSRLDPADGRVFGELRDADGVVQLRIEAKGERQLTRRLAAALDAADTVAGLRPDIFRELPNAIEAEPRFLWLVGPNTIDPALHVFRFDTGGVQTRLARVDAVPAPV